ncbi:hypothetical protein GCM10007094_20370 [Pseudovibrio japonicus]|uniref:Uncharacterized protein n=1 Tax=Pseudovibrio japonicus TaxID=366534 RepID=A0ABQ3EC15_9HYPH|nr:hypothetical protein GCM10007094_20370 [Pseudovibrio japonicus]
MPEQVGVVERHCEALCVMPVVEKAFIPIALADEIVEGFIFEPAKELLGQNVVPDPEAMGLQRLRA